MRRREWMLGSLALSLGCGRQPDVESKPGTAAGAVTPEQPTAIRLLTYNVLADEVAVDRRIPALLRVMAAARPDILALQEVAPWFLDHLAGAGWASALQPARIDGRLARPNGQVIFSRWPISAARHRVLSGRQGRTVLIARTEIGDGKQLAVATTHMESFLEDGPTRAQQLDEIFAELAHERDDPRVSATVLAGDFNFGDGEQPDSAHLDPDFRDLWTQLHPGEPGFTWDIEHSEMARAGSFVGEPSRRLDRVLLRARDWTPTSIEIIGDQAVEPGDRRVFPSDHFGLSAEFERVESG